MKLIESYTTTHDSISAETGKNDGDRTSGDCISRTQAIMAIEQHETAILEGHKWDEGIEYGYAAAHRHLVDIIEQLPSAQPDIIHCKDCKWYGRADKRRFYRGMDCLQKRIDTIVPDRDFCSRAERREDAID